MNKKIEEVHLVRLQQCQELQFAQQAAVRRTEVEKHNSHKDTKRRGLKDSNY
ncbi:hypothetical protein BB14905_13910 [Bacillus sp. B14905]|nr:hypothetical protein BB14905_13910 [Bacillus sp. B14905]